MDAEDNGLRTSQYMIMCNMYLGSRCQTYAQSYHFEDGRKQVSNKPIPP